MWFKTTASVLTLVFVMGLAVLALGAVQQPPRQSSDPLVQEVQQLRVALEHYFQVSTQVDLTAQRANAVQMRISSLSWELADVRTQLARTSAEVTRNAALMNQEQLMPNVVADAKRQVEAQTQLEQQLRTRESQVAAALAAEQSKWNELSQRLDALERAISAGRQ
jgi:chromosome segregation ATPase